MSAADIGQSCAVRSRQAVAVETVFGTDWMLETLIRRPDGQGGVMVKAPKTGQDRRADLHHGGGLLALGKLVEVEAHGSGTNL